MSLLSERVDRGSKLLDKIEPGWADLIDLNDLNMGVCVDCILGQLYGNYQLGINVLPEEQLPEYYGFNIPFDLSIERYSYYALGQAWKEEILKRKLQ